LAELTKLARQVHNFYPCCRLSVFQGSVQR
jgi:hypothetical protein